MNRALARTAGTVGAVLVTIAVALVASDWMLIGFAVFAMVAGLAHLLRSPFLTAVGTTVLTVATGFLTGTSTNAAERLLSTVVGAAVGLLATMLVPVPGASEKSRTADQADAT